jgi:hypothetical protein
VALELDAGRVAEVVSAGARQTPRARYMPIAEHGLIGDLHTVALVGTDGTIDWYCCPRGLLLRSYGWRIVFLGADTPIATLTQAAETTRPALTVLASFDPDLLETEASALRRLAKRVPLVLSGPGASDALCSRLGARRLDGDLVRAAGEVGQGTFG